MPHRRQTVSQYILEQQNNDLRLDADFAALIDSLQNACRSIATIASQGALGVSSEKTMCTNVQGEEQKLLDVLSNDIVIECCEQEGQLCGMVSEIETAVRKALKRTGKPTLVCCKTVIGCGAPNMAGTHDVHGAPLGAAETAATRAALNWPYPAFEIPCDVKQAWDGQKKGRLVHDAWNLRFKNYAAAYPHQAAEFSRRMSGKLPVDFAAKADAWTAASTRAVDPVATRKASQSIISELTADIPELLGGSADLTGSNLTNWKGCRPVGRNKAGNYIHYGVREFGMSAIMNGIALHGGFIPFGGTFLVFSDYARNALRLSALMGLRVIYVFTHDSIGLGEDGPTHQPIEHVASLRLMPNMDVWRPCDLLETAVAWRAAIERSEGPSSLILSRQNLPHQGDGQLRAEHAARGGYVLADSESGRPDIVLIATGSEVALAIAARKQLAERGIDARVVSMPSTTTFDRQAMAFRAAVLPEGVKRVAIEAGASDLWRKYVGLEGAVVGIDRFGESAPGPMLFNHFGFTPERVAEIAAALL